MFHIGAKGEEVHLRSKDTSILRVYYQGERVCVIAFTTQDDGGVTIQVEHEGLFELEETFPGL